MMNDAARPALAMALLATLVFELAVLAPAAEAPLPAGSPEVAIAPAIAGLPSDNGHDGWAAVILARPLFDAGRRPAVLSANSVSGLPRLSGVIVSQSKRLAFFAGIGGGPPVVAMEGDRVGGVVLLTIAPDQVVVIGPAGAQRLRPAFDPASATVAAGKKTDAKSAERAQATEGQQQSLIDRVRNASRPNIVSLQ